MNPGKQSELKLDAISGVHAGQAAPAAGKAILQPLDHTAKATC
ncbi:MULTISPECIES: hypothetical protein [Comamonas]|jgi:hypothetical protein|nr:MULTISPECIES: hypothetical protein [Comamonas]EFI62712.1 hypothetical protein CTS44_05091 [Comamonas thiooxydans]MDH1253308.1 hypothetical protein [Comamonas thiooxydans]